jgi:uncharacterized protein
VNLDEKIDSYIRNVFAKFGSGAHTYDHTKRVHAMATRIGEQLGADMRVLGAAALLHDVGRPYEKKTGVSHAIHSGEMSRQILQEIGYSTSEIERVIEAMRTHRFSEHLRPTSLEGEILSDTDKLDAMGAIGIYRAIAQAVITDVGVKGFLTHANEKLLKLYDLMYTEPAKKEAQKRHSILSSFVHQLINETKNDHSY